MSAANAARLPLRGLQVAQKSRHRVMMRAYTTTVAARKLQPSGESSSSRKALQRAWTTRRLRATDLRSAIFRKWGRTFDIDLAEVDGNLHVILYVCEPEPKDTHAYNKKLGEVARRITAMNAASLLQQRLQSIAEEEMPDCHACLVDQGDDDHTTVLAIPIDVTLARACEFNLSEYRV